jgi:hypothetical protein
MMAATLANLAAAGVNEAIGTLLFDAGYLSEDNITAPGPQRLIGTAKSRKLRQQARLNGYSQGPPPPDAGPIEAMEHRLTTQIGAQLYSQRQHIIEPVFGHTKHNRRFDRFSRRGRRAVDSEWKLIATAHNITKLFTLRPTTPATI